MEDKLIDQLPFDAAARSRQVCARLAHAHMFNLPVSVRWSGLDLPPLRVANVILDGNPSTRLENGAPQSVSAVVILAVSEIENVTIFGGANNG